MFYENNVASDFSFQVGLPASSPQNAARHLINRLRLEFRTASQRQLEDAVNAALAADTGEKAFQLARLSLAQLLTPKQDELESSPTESEPPFRTPS